MFLLIINTKKLELKLGHCALLLCYKNTLLLIVEIISAIKHRMLIILLQKAMQYTSPINLVVMEDFVLKADYTTMLKIIMSRKFFLFSFI